MRKLQLKRIKQKYGIQVSLYRNKTKIKLSLKMNLNLKLTSNQLQEGSKDGTEGGLPGQGRAT